MDSAAMKDRTMKFGLRVIRLVTALPKSKASDVIGYQLLKAGTSVGANYRAACRARSHADFLSKLGIVEEETDESVYWMNVLIEAGMVKPKMLQELIREGEEILAIVVASIVTAKRRQKAARARTIRNPQSAIRNGQQLVS